MTADDKKDERTETLIHEAMETFGIDRAKAVFMINQALGKIDGDLRGASDLSAEERDDMGLGRTLEEALHRDDRSARRSA